MPPHRRRSALAFFALLTVTAFAAVATFNVGDPVEVLWSGSWYKAKVIGAEEGKWRITYEGYGSNWDETVGPDRIRPRPAAAASSSNVADAATSQPSADPAAATFPFPERPAGKPAGIQGAFLRVESWFFNGRLSLTQQGWFFTSDGRVSLTPVGGFDFARFVEATHARKSDGVYWIDGDKLVVQWAHNAKTDTYAYESKPDGTLTLDGLAATRVDGFPRGWRADVVYEGGASVRGGGSYLASANSLHLRRDGTFGGEAVGSVSTVAAGQTVGGGSSSSTAGTYEFDGYTLTLRHADGRIEPRTVFAFSDRDAHGAPEFIWREGSMLSRRDRN